MNTIFQNSKLRYGFFIGLACLCLIATLVNSSIVSNGEVKNVYLYGVVDDVSTQPILEALNNANSNDTVVIHIESPGGSVLAGYWVIDAIKTTKAKVVEAHVDGYAASMAAVIAMYADKIVLKDNAVIIFHSYSVDDKKVAPSPDKTLQLFYQQSVEELTQCCSKVLTGSDMFSIIYEQQDLVFSGKEIMERLEIWKKSHQ